MFFNVQRWSLHDGPGIRTTVFFKGCPLRCRWCSNPESWSFERQLFFRAHQCIGCGACVDVCPSGASSADGKEIALDRSRCTACGSCTAVCPQKARELVGLNWSALDIVRLIERDAIFYRSSGGGVTFSGGEPFAQPQVLQQLARSCAAAGIRTAVETCGHFELAAAGEMIELIDDIFIDLKHADERAHRELTGVSNKTIIANIVRLDKMGRALTIRVPLVKGLTDTDGNIDAVGRIAGGLEHLIEIELLPYHRLGAVKYGSLDLACDDQLAAPEKERVAQILARLRARGLKARSAGDDRPTNKEC